MLGLHNTGLTKFKASDSRVKVLRPSGPLGMDVLAQGFTCNYQSEKGFLLTFWLTLCSSS